MAEPRAEPRVFVYAVETQRGLRAQFTPSGFEEASEAVYENMSGQGASYEISQFDHTKNQTISWTLKYDRVLLAEQLRAAGRYDTRVIKAAMISAKHFFQALTFPRQVPGSALVQRPPSALLIWPNVIAYQARTMRVRIAHEEFDRVDFSLSAFTAELEFERKNEIPLYWDDVFDRGSLWEGEVSV